MVERRLTLRDRMLGVLLRDTRRQNGMTKQECADALGVPVSTIDAYEEGRKPISLPELEVLGYLLDTPASQLLRPEAGLEPESDDPDFGAVLNLRHRIIGALLRQARMEADLQQEDLAELLDQPTSRIADYERGVETIPVSELEILAQHVDVTIDRFLNCREGPVGEWHRQVEMDQSFHQLPDDVQEFVTKPINIKYLEVAMKLSQMPASKLRAIAEGLLEITY